MAHGRFLTLDAPRIVAILNVTPDSFSDGGEIGGPAGAAQRAEAALEAGAHMLDVGGESTRPGAARIDAEEQIRRVVPAIEAIRRAGLACPISVDTTLAPVARAALDAGADCVNDVSGAREDDAMLALAAERSAGLVLMHRLRPPGDDRYSDRYTDDAPNYDHAGGVVAVVCAFLRDRALAALDAGVAREAIVVDPGLGFGKTVSQNLELVNAAPLILAGGFPVLSAASRKSFVGRLSGVEAPAERIAGSVAISVAQLLAGVRLFRVHDVRQHAEALRVAWGLVESSGSGAG
jgi:dihydropteroate synthase